MKFRLERKPQRPDDTLAYYRILNAAGDALGHVNVPIEQAADLEKHWSRATPQPLAAATPRALQPTASAAAKKNAFAEAIKAKRPGARPVDYASKPDPAVDAMVAAAPKHTLSKEACLRT